MEAHTTRNCPAVIFLDKKQNFIGSFGIGIKRPVNEFNRLRSALREPDYIVFNPLQIKETKRRASSGKTEGTAVRAPSGCFNITYPAVEAFKKFNAIG